MAAPAEPSHPDNPQQPPETRTLPPASVPGPYTTQEPAAIPPDAGAADGGWRREPSGGQQPLNRSSLLQDLLLRW
jgi:hypothetical protein